MPAWAILACHPPGCPAQSLRTQYRGKQRLVSQGTSDLQRYSRRRATSHLVRARFPHIPAQRSQHKTPASAPARLGLRPLSRRLMAKVEVRGDALWRVGPCKYPWSCLPANSHDGFRPSSPSARSCLGCALRQPGRVPCSHCEVGTCCRSRREATRHRTAVRVPQAVRHWSEPGSWTR